MRKGDLGLDGYLVWTNYRGCVRALWDVALHGEIRQEVKWCEVKWCEVRGVVMRREIGEAR